MVYTTWTKTSLFALSFATIQSHIGQKVYLQYFFLSLGYETPGDTCSSVTVSAGISDTLGAGGKPSSAGVGGCCCSRASRTSAEGWMNSSLEVRIRSAALTSPSAHLLCTLRATESSAVFLRSFGWLCRCSLGTLAVGVELFFLFLDYCSDGCSRASGCLARCSENH